MRRSWVALLAMVLVAWAQPARAQFVAHDPTNDFILLENVRQTFQGAQQLEQLRQTLSTAKDQVQILRDAYAGINEFKNFSADDFLGEGKAYFLRQSGAGEAVDFGQDLLANGLEGGHFNARSFYAHADVYLDEQRRRQSRSADGIQPYDAAQAMGLSAELSAATAHPAVQKRLLARPPPDTISEGLFDYDASRTDPNLLELYAYRRAKSEAAEQAALKVLAESMGATSAGKAQQLSAKSTAVTAVEVARLNATQSKALTMQELTRQEEAQAAAHQRKEMDALWQGLQKEAESSFSRGPRARALPSMGVK